MGNPSEKPKSGDADRAVVEPIVIKVPLECAPQRAFAYFTRDIGKWWPLAKYSVNRDRASDVAIEPKSGGRIFEIDSDGNLHPWGRVCEWDPPRKLRFSWHPGLDEASAQWVEVTFVSHLEGTLVTLTHGGWEALGERGVAARASYAGGWPAVIGTSFVNYAKEKERS